MDLADELARITQERDDLIAMVDYLEMQVIELEDAVRNNYGL